MSAHKNLTGADLHEPKGIESAAAGEVYVADGSDSGEWQKIDNDQLEKDAKPFGHNVLIVEERQVSGTAGGTFSANAWRTRALSTVVTNQITGASLANNRITLPAGTYMIQAEAVAYKVDSHAVRLQNITSAAEIAVGVAASSDNLDGTTSTSNVWARVVLGTTSRIELQHRCTNTQALDGFGVATSFGVERYARVCVWKVD